MKKSTIIEINDDICTLETSKNGKIKMCKSAINKENQVFYILYQTSGYQIDEIHNLPKPTLKLKYGFIELIEPIKIKPGQVII